MKVRERLEPKRALSSVGKRSERTASAVPQRAEVAVPALEGALSREIAASAGGNMALDSRPRVGGEAEAQRTLTQLQRQYGNRHVQRVLEATRQPEKDEEEELRAQRKNEEGEEEQEILAQRQGQSGPTVVSEVEAAINSKRGGGQVLEGGVRDQMAAAFGTDFSNVRVHTDSSADALNRTLMARAFTVGSDIFFRGGEYRPGSSSGNELLAHELTHVVQQNGNQVQTKLTVSEPGDQYEQEAEQVAHAIGRQPQQPMPQSGVRWGIEELAEEGSSTSEYGATAQRAPEEGIIQRVEPPVGTVETSEGEEEIEGEVITSSAEDVNERLTENEESINDRIQSWTEDGVGDLRDGIQDAGDSFKLWYEARPRRPNTAEFVMDVASAAVSVIGTFFPPSALAFAVVGGLLSLAKGPIKDALDPNAEPAEQARQLQQNMLRLSSQVDRSFASFGPRLKREQADVWNNIGIALTMDPPLIGIAREVLHDEAGVPAINQPYGEQILSQMIYTYTDWEQRHELEESTFFISSESVEYSLFTEDVRRRLRAQAEAEARRRLGPTEEEE